jgi:putative spermidine/putrescine transport system substrate-binding protein
MFMKYDNSRREALRYIGSGLLAAGTLPLVSGLSGCTKKEQTLRFFGTGTLDIGDENWVEVTKLLGTKIDFVDNKNDVGPILAQMINGTAADTYDLGGVQGGAEPEMFRSRAIEPWDLSKIPNWQSMWDDMKEIPYLNIEGQQIGIPLAANADSMIFLKNETGVVDSYSAIFDRRFKGRTAMEDSWMNSVIFTAIFMKANNIDQMGKIAEPGDLTEDELGTVFEFLKGHKRDGQFLKFWSGWTEGRDLIVNRKVAVMTGWEPIYYAARDLGVADVGYAVPVEGYEGWSNNLVLHRGAIARNNREIAHQFANWLLDGWYGCVLGAMRGYVVPTEKSIERATKGDVDYYNLEKAQRAKVTLEEVTSLGSRVRNKFEQQKGRVHWQNARPKLYEQYERGWAELRAL